MLSALPLPALASSNLLAVDPTSHIASQILVRFRTDQAAPHESGTLAGSSYGRASALVSGLREIKLEEGVGIDDALAFYRSMPSVLYAEPNYRVQLEAAPDDPYFNRLWGLHNTGESGGKRDADIDALEAWSLSTPAVGTIVAVIDTGVDYTHPDLSANMWNNPGEIAGNGIDDDENGFVDDLHGADFIHQDGDPFDDHGHGTHVSGTIAAVHNNGQGVAGVNPGAKIMALKFLDEFGHGSVLDAVTALDYAIAHGAKVSNHSWSGSAFSQTLQDAIQRAQQAGHIVVAAAGNRMTNLDASPSYPAGYDLDNILAVAATDRNDRLAPFSNFGRRHVDLAAPGQSILSTTPANTYDVFSGTSMAAPHVAGAVSRLWDQNPDWDYTQVIQQVLTTVDPLPVLAGKTVTGGRLNLAQAMGLDMRSPRVVSSSPRGVVSGSIAELQITFSEPIDAATFTKSDIIRLTGPGGELAASRVTGSETTFTVSFPRQSKPGVYTMVIGPHIRDLAGNEMDQNGDRVGGETSQDTFTARVTLANSLRVAAGSDSLSVQNNGSAVSYLDVRQDTVIADLDVWLDIRYARKSHLRIYLVGPGGVGHQRVLLSSLPEGGANAYRSIRFDDETPRFLANRLGLFHRYDRPEEPLSGLDGRNARGRWALVIEGPVGAGSVRLKSWSLIIKPRKADFLEPPVESTSTGPLSQDRGSSISPETARDLALAMIVEERRRQTGTTPWFSGPADAIAPPR